jgi:hypothetical protein
MPQDIILAERVKELSHDTGVGDLKLSGPVSGFSSFGSSYSYNDFVYYAITDGTNYEVGSGQYVLNGSDSAIRRFPFRSTNSNQKVNFGAGVKEVYVTYPGKYSVYSASGIGAFSEPSASGLAFWGSRNIIDYDPSLIWDKTNDYLGIKKSSPNYAIDIGGPEHYSQINASGFIVGDSGIMFSGVDPTYSGGRQLEPFLRNTLNSLTGTDAVFGLSGLVDQIILFKKQMAGTVLAGPPSGCTPSLTCPENYPIFRALVVDDIPDLSDLYLTQKIDAYYLGMSSGIAFFHESGVIDTDNLLVWNNTDNRLGVNIATPAATLDVNGDARVGGSLIVAGNATVTGNLDIKGNLTYVNSSNITMWDKNLELASLSGVAQGGDSTIDDAGIIIKSTQGDKKWTWRDATDSWTTSEKISVSGIIFNDNSIISGAYQAGSGLSLHNGRLFNVGNMFTVSADDAVTRNIHQADQLSISGVSGINIVSSKSGSLVSVLVDNGVVSGCAYYASGVAVYASGLLSPNSKITVDTVEANSFQLASGGWLLVSGTTYTLSNNDNGRVLLFSNESGVLLTVASGLKFGLATNFLQIGAGQVQVSGDDGVTIYNRQNHNKTAGQHSRAGLMHYSQNIYNFAGDTST